MAWQVSPKAVEWHHETETNIRVGLRAENIRTTQTGLHAKISVLQNTYPISYDTFNVERHADRIRLINASYAGFAAGEVSKPEFAGYVHQFCQVFWEKWSDQYAVEDVGGDPALPPRCYLLEPYILAGAGTILFGPPGRGKSTLAMLMAQSINAGVGTYWPVTHAPALYVNLERSKESIQRRLTLVNIQLGLEPEFSLPMANARGRSLVDVLGSIERAVTKRGTRIVFLDSITRGGYGSLIADDIANKIMDGLNGMCESWVGLAHTPRGDETHAFGSQMFDAAADMTVQLVSQRKVEGTLGIGLQVTKANDIAFPDMAIWAAEFDQYGLSGFRSARRGEFPDVEGQKKMGMADQIHDHLLNIGADDATTIAETLGFSRTNVSRTLSADPRFGTQRDGKRVLYMVKSGMNV